MEKVKVSISNIPRELMEKVCKEIQENKAKSPKKKGA